MTDNSLSDLDPKLQSIAQEWLAKCNAQFTTRITVTWRSADEQGAAFDKGLSNAKAGQSPHNVCNADGSPCARAFDFAIFDNGEYVTDGTDPRYAQAGQIGKDLGLAWGGDWHHPDFDHLETVDWKTA
jgi:hypothetical protein